MLSCTASAAAVHSALLSIPLSCQRAHEWKLLKFKTSKIRFRLCAIAPTSSASVEEFQSTPKPKAKPTLPTLPQEGEDSNGSNSFHVCEKIIRLCRAEEYQEALDIFRIVQRHGVEVDAYTYAYLLKGCTVMKNIEEGRRVHTHLQQSGVLPDHFLATKLVIMYVKFGMLLEAHQMFDKMPQPVLEAWNSLIAGHAQHGQSYQALELFGEMLRQGLVLDEYTLTSVVRACAGLAAIDTGQQVHACIVKRGLQKHVYVESAMVDIMGTGRRL
ncbi:hypothetical protein SUGI_1164670 [Cryptomeria japonica]|nr:hypothetical protein SUGI_1164670 [Cryptomeria japonica]